MRIAIVGCGYVADFYMATLANYPSLELVGAFDRNPLRADPFSQYHRIYKYNRIDDLLADSRVELVLNLTNPRSHFEISRASLLAGKHVYSEKPLAMTMDEARELVRIADERGLYLSAAPCNVLGESAQTLWKALRSGHIGQPRLVYAEVDDGMIFKTHFRKWISDSGAPWPYKDEFEIGCTMEHAGYALTWLCAFFGPAKSIQSFAACLVPDKVPGEELNRISADFSSACIEYHSGVVARVTCSLIAAHDHRFRVIGDEGVLETEDTWNYGSSVYIRRDSSPLHQRISRHRFLAKLSALVKQKVPLVRKPAFQHRSRGGGFMDFARGPAELAQAVLEGRPCRLSSRFALHVTELVLAMEALQQSGGGQHQVQTSFDPMPPMPWAMGQHQ